MLFDGLVHELWLVVLMIFDGLGSFIADCGVFDDVRDFVCFFPVVSICVFFVF